MDRVKNIYIPLSHNDMLRGETQHVVGTIGIYYRAGLRLRETW
jgi:hypothetical protein